MVSFSHLPLHSALLPHKEPECASRFPLERSQRQPRIRSGCCGEEKNFRYCEESSPVPQARCHVQCMPSQHCMTCPGVAGLFLFLDRCLSFFRSSFLASLLVLFSILFFDLNAAVGSNSCTASSGWITHGTSIGNRACPETSVTNYQSALRNMAEERSFYYSFTYLSLCESIKTQKVGLNEAAIKFYIYIFSKTIKGR